jgi:hypothetical protein
VKVPAGPCLDSDAARAIGPIELVCAPQQFEVIRVAGHTLLAFLVVPVSLGFLLLMVFNELAVAGFVQPELGWALFFVGWAMVVLWFLFSGLRRLRQRLLLGERGIALWSPGGARVVLWEELGWIWRRVPSREHLYRPLSVALEHSDGTRLAITRFFSNHHRIALRVLQELARRAVESGDADYCWLGHPITRQFGPVKQVCTQLAKVAPAERVERLLLERFLPLLPMSLLGTVAFSMAFPWLAVPCCGMPLLIGLIELGVNELRDGTRCYLLLGENGVAYWVPGWLIVIPWEELGVVWQVKPGEGSLTLVREDGFQVEILPFFPDAGDVAARILAELTSRLRGKTWAGRPRPTTPDVPTVENITPAERGVSEPEAER